MNFSIEAAPASVPPASCASSLFRASLRLGQAHPLLHLLRRYRRDETPLVVEPVSTGNPATAPQARIDATNLARCVKELPALPQAVMEALAALNDDDVHLDECARRIERDPAITALTLRLANSAFFGVPGKVGSIADAINVLGLRSLASLLTTAAVSTQFGPALCPGFDFSAFWRHAIGAGIAARSLAQCCRLDPAQSFVAGLLHDVGQLALAVHFPEPTAVALAWARQADLPLQGAERLVLGIDHTQVGAAISAHWHLPPEVVEAISRHHEMVGSGPATLTHMVQMADALVHALDLNRNVCERVPPIELAAWAQCRVSVEQGLEILKAVDTGVDEICRLLGLGG